MNKDSKGRWLPGNTAGGVSGKRRLTNEAWDSVYTPHKVKQLAKKLFSMAMEGNIRALIYCTDRSLGKVVEKYEIKQEQTPPRNPEVVRQEVLAMMRRNFPQLPPSSIH
jgi:hypothetical protein